MITEIVNLSIDGVPQDEIVPDIIEIEVEEDVAAADVFRVRVALVTRSDGSWNYLDDERFGLTEPPSPPSPFVLINRFRATTTSSRIRRDAMLCGQKSPCFRSRESDWSRQ